MTRISVLTVLAENRLADLGVFVLWGQQICDGGLRVPVVLIHRPTDPQCPGRQVGHREFYARPVGAFSSGETCFEVASDLALTPAPPVAPPA